MKFFKQCLFVFLLALSLVSTQRVSAQENKEDKIEVSIRYTYEETQEYVAERKERIDEIAKRNIPHVTAKLLDANNSIITVTEDLNTIEIFYHKQDTCPLPKTPVGVVPNTPNPTPTPKAKPLPSTGQLEGYYVLFGLTAITSSFVFYRKAKHNKHLLVLLILLGFIGINTQITQASIVIIDREKNTLALQKEDEHKFFKVGDTIDLSKHFKVDDKTCIVPFGYFVFRDEKPTPPPQPPQPTRFGTVIVRHFDWLGHKLAEDEVIADNEPVNARVELPAAKQFTITDIGKFYDDTPKPSPVSQEDKQRIVDKISGIYDKAIKFIESWEVERKDDFYDYHSYVIIPLELRNSNYKQTIDDIIAKYPIVKQGNSSFHFEGSREKYEEDKEKSKQLQQELEPILEEYKQQEITKLEAAKQANNHIPESWNHLYVYPTQDRKEVTYPNMPDREMDWYVNGNPNEINPTVSTHTNPYQPEPPKRPSRPVDSPPSTPISPGGPGVYDLSQHLEHIWYSNQTEPLLRGMVDSRQLLSGVFYYQIYDSIDTMQLDKAKILHHEDCRIYGNPYGMYNYTRRIKNDGYRESDIYVQEGITYVDYYYRPAVSTYEGACLGKQ